MKLLYLPLNVAGDFQDGTTQAFVQELGAENVVVFDYLTRMLPDSSLELGRLVAQYAPDWVHMQLQETGKILPSSIESIRKGSPRVVWTHWMGDWREGISPKLAEICRITDATFISNEGQIPMYEQTGAPLVRYWQNAVTESIDVSPPQFVRLAFRVPEVVLCANLNMRFPGAQERVDVVKAFMASGLDFGLVGAGWPAEFRPIARTGPRMQRHIYEKARVVVGVNHVNDCERYYSERQLAAMASGKPHVCWGVPGLEKDFEDESECLFYTTPEKAVELTRELLANPGWADSIGKAGQEKVLDFHLWPHRVREIMPIIEELVRDKQ